MKTPLASTSRPDAVTRRVFGLGLASLALAMPRGARAQAAVFFRRGIGVAETFAYPRRDGAGPGGYAAQPFDLAAPPSTAEMVALKRHGFDFVRLAVDPGPFIAFEGEARQRLFDVVFARIRQFRAAGLAVLLDLHPSDAGGPLADRALTAGVSSPMFQSYLAIMTRFARTLEELASPQLALELMNEPRIDAARWQPMLLAAWQAARRAAPTLTLVLAGGDTGSVNGLTGIDARPFAADPAALFTFHYYEPYQFTHQGAPWTHAAGRLAGVPYPADARPMAQAFAESNALIDGLRLPLTETASAYLDARRRLESYRLKGFNRADIRQDFAGVTAWARRNGILPQRLLLGEFGARVTTTNREGPRALERATWYRDVREEAEAQGYRWAVWEHRGLGGFGLVEGADVALKPDIAAALGLSRAD